MNRRDLELRARARLALGERSALSSFESFLTAPAGFGLATASPVQRAFCRVVEGSGLRELASDPAVVRALGGQRAVDLLREPGSPPIEVYLFAAIRCGKSLIAGAAATLSALRCDVSGLGAGDEPRASVLSLRLKEAGVIFKHCTGRIGASPQLAARLLGEPTADTIRLRHRTGIPSEIFVTAGARAGGSLVAHWSSGAIFDEAPRMVGAGEGVINLDDARHAVLGRLLPGGSALYIGSKWAPFGPAYNAWAEHFGHPQPGRVVVMDANGPDMLPGYWTPERCERHRHVDPIGYRTDVENKWLDAETAFFAVDAIAAATREGPVRLSRDPRCHYVAAMDPGTRSNAWTLIVLTCTGRNKDTGRPRYAVALARQWKPERGAPLRPRVVLGEIAAELRGYGVDHVLTDQWAADAIADIADEFGLAVSERTWTTSEQVDAFEDVRVSLIEGGLEIPSDEQLRRDLVMVKRSVTRTGVAIELPHTSDGRHCDYAPALARAMSLRPDEPDAVKPDPGTADYFRAESERMLEEAIERQERRLREDGEEDWNGD